MGELTAYGAGVGNPSGPVHDEGRPGPASQV